MVGLKEIEGGGGGLVCVNLDVMSEGVFIVESFEEDLVIFEVGFGGGGGGFEGEGFVFFDWVGGVLGEDEGGVGCYDGCCCGD